MDTEHSHKNEKYAICNNTDSLEGIEICETSHKEKTTTLRNLKLKVWSITETDSQMQRTK